MEEEEEEGGKGKPRSAEADAHTHTHAQVIPPSSLLTRCSTCIPTRREEREREREMKEERERKISRRVPPTGGRLSLTRSCLQEVKERERERQQNTGRHWRKGCEGAGESERRKESGREWDRRKEASDRDTGVRRGAATVGQQLVV